MSDVTDLKAEVLLLRRENKELRKICRELYCIAWYECPSAFMTEFTNRMLKLNINIFDERRTNGMEA